MDKLQYNQTSFHVLYRNYSGTCLFKVLPVYTIMYAQFPISNQSIWWQKHLIWKTKSSTVSMSKRISNMIKKSAVSKLFYYVIMSTCLGLGSQFEHLTHNFNFIMWVINSNNFSSNKLHESYTYTIQISYWKQSKKKIVWYFTSAL